MINPYYMRQLLHYGIKLGETQTSDMSPESLLQEAEVCCLLASPLSPPLIFYARLPTAPRSRAQIDSTIGFFQLHQPCHCIIHSSQLHMYVIFASIHGPVFPCPPTLISGLMQLTHGIFPPIWEKEKKSKRTPCVGFSPFACLSLVAFLSCFPLLFTPGLVQVAAPHDLYVHMELCTC